jgi:micrococcal nuclease
MTKRRAYFWALVCILVVSIVVVLVYKTVDVQKILPSQVVQPGFYSVLEVYDGDTIAVDMNGTTERVRMIGVDTPETHHPNQPVQCYGPEASNYTNQLLSGKTVRLEADPTNQNRDRYDRLLRYVYAENGDLVNQNLISLGYGFEYLSFRFEKSKEFAEIGDTARQNKVGLWSACQPTFKDGRWQSNAL